MARNSLITVSTLGFSCFFFLIVLAMTGMSSAEPAAQDQRAGGTERSSGGLAGACEPGWLLDIGQPGMNGFVRATTVYNGSLIAGGDFTTAGGETVNRIARWDGQAWHPLSAGGQIGVGDEWFHGVRALTVYDGSLVAGGEFTTAGGQTVNNIARWDGQAWQPLSSGGQTGVNSLVESLTVYKGDLVAGGTFTSAGGQTVNRIARWDGAAWQPLTSGGQTGVEGPVVYSLTVYNGSLVAGGEFTTAGGQTVNNIGRWDGAAWQPFTSGGETGVNGPVFALTSYGGSLVAGGQFTTAGGQMVNFIARWDGQTWQPFFSGGQTGVSGTVRAMTQYGASLVVSGAFSVAGGQTANFLAQWDGAALQPLSPGGETGLDGMPWTLTVYSGKLVTGGQFTMAGGMTAIRIALWDGCLTTDGACCINGVALEVAISESGCLAVGGAFQGEGTDPGQATCPQPGPTCTGDINGDGVVDVFDLLELLNNWGACEGDEPAPTEGCGAPDTGSCFESSGTPYCNNAACCETVCACDPFCCETEWDSLCAGGGVNDQGCGAAVLCTP